MDFSSFFDDFDRRDWQHIDSGTIRVAMIGLGWWTRARAIPAVDASDHCETTILVSGDREKAAAVADTTPTATGGITYDEFTEGTASDCYDAVYICTPNALHLPYAETAADLGKHVLCEKPMEATIERAELMVEACDNADISLMIGYRMQTEPAIRRVHDLIQNGVIGEAAHITSHMTQRLLEVIPDPDQWRLNPDLVGRGASVTDLGIYPLNTARFVLDADPARVAASMWSSNDRFERVPDERASFEIEFENGVLASCAASQNAQQSGRFEVVGTRGRLALEPAFFGDDRRSLGVMIGDTSFEVTFETVNQMTEQFDYFADRILSGRAIHPDGEHGLVDMQTIDAIYQAAETSTWIDL